MTTPSEPVLTDPLARPPPRIIEDHHHHNHNNPNSQQQQQQQQQQRIPGKAVRPKGLHTKHLTALERFRVRTLYYDAGLSRDRVHQITGYSKNQIRTAVRAKSAAVGKRSGRPRKFGASNTGAPAPSSPDPDAELIQQAQNALAREGHELTGLAANAADPDKNNSNINRGISEDENDYANDPHRLLSPHITSSSTALTRTPPGIPPARPGITFNDLPSAIRTSIWRHALSIAPTASASGSGSGSGTPISRSWALYVYARPPWLELSASPPPAPMPMSFTQANPPWSQYVERRHVPAMVLTRVNREARGVVLERFTPILVGMGTGSRGMGSGTGAGTGSGSGAGFPNFVWIDRQWDVLHFFGPGGFRGELLELAGRCAWPGLYGVRKTIMTTDGDGDGDGGMSSEEDEEQEQEGDEEEEEDELELVMESGSQG